MSDKEEDYLDKLLDSINEKEQADSQQEKPKSEWQQEIKEKDPEEIARQVREKIESENAGEEDTEEKKDAMAEEAVDKMLEDTPVEEAAGATITSDDDMELSDNDMKRLMNMNLDDIIDDVKSDSASIDDLFGSSPDKETEHNEKSADTQAQTISADDKKKLKPQKEGFFKKIKKVFFDSLEDDTETVESASEAAESASEAVGEKERIEENVVKESSDKGNSSSGDEPKDENEQIIEDVFGNKSTLDESQVPKKGFFARLKYRLEQMKAKHIEEEKAEEEAERLEEEEKQKNKELKKAAATEKKEQKKQAGEAKKAQKANKPKKVKPKKVKKPKEPPKPQDILKIKPVSIVMLVLFVAGVSVLISVLSSGFYYNNSVSLAKDYYSNEQYEKAYDKLSGIKLNGSDKTLYEQASTIMYVQKQYDSYENYMKLNMKTEALDSLIKGVNRYNSLRPQAQELGIDNKFTAVYKQIVLALQDTFKISETEAIGLSSMSDTDFTNYYYRIEEYGKAVQ